MNRLGVTVALAAVFAFPGASAADVKVTDQASYTRHDGGSDPAIVSCGSDATTPTAGGDAGGERQANEPVVAIRPDEPGFIVAAANDYCTVPITADAWHGIYTSSDGGLSWKNSLLPGYPGDSSAEGQASPLFGTNTAAGDPNLDWDNHGHLFETGGAFNRTVTREQGPVAPANGRVFVATYVRSPFAPIGLDYLRTVIVGEGTPNAFAFSGRFNDEPNVKVDDWRSSSFEGNVYVSWSLFTGGQDQLLFSRSTDGGQSFSKPIKISSSGVPGGLPGQEASDIAVAPDGTVYVVWRAFSFFVGVPSFDFIVFAKSTDGGKHFSDPQTIGAVVGYDRRDQLVSGDSTRACGDGPFLCVTGFVFHRLGSGPRVTADSDGNVYVTWDQVALVGDNGDTYWAYSGAASDGQSRVVVSNSTNGGATWSDLLPVDPQAVGHQFKPDIEYNKAQDKLVLIYWDSRLDPSYSVYRPPGNLANGLSVCGVPASAVCNVLNTFIATSSDGVSWSPSLVSTVGHQPEYEMFGNRDQPFHGDYNAVASVGGMTYGVWADNRDVIPGDDPREATQDGFDVHQCRTANPDGSFGADLCPNAGGLDQNIYGGTP
jgi:hypothetical protein